MTAVAETTARSAEKYRVTRSRRNVAWTGLGALVVVVVLALFPYLVGAGTETILVQAFIILTLASMWNLLAGYAGLVSVGQQAFVGLGAYFVLILNIHNLSMFTALPIAAIGCGVAALPMWWLVSRLRSGYFAIATWVLATTILLIIEKFPSIGGGTGLSLPHTPSLSSAVLEAYTYWIGLAVTVLALLGVYLLLRSRLGLVLTAVRDDEVAARSSGARVGLARMLVFVVAGIGCGAAGALLAVSQLIVQPSAVFSVQFTAEMAFAVIIGGLGTIEGPILGTIVYMVLQQTLQSYNAWYLIILGLVAMGVAIFARRGLWGLVDEHLHVRLFPVGYWLWDPASAGRSRRPWSASSPGWPARLGPARRENGWMLLAEIAEVSQAVAATSARLAKIEMLAAALREAGPLEVPIAVAYLSGELPQRQIGVGWAALRDGFRPAVVPTLGLAEVDAAFSAIGAVAGKGSAAARKALVGELFGRATSAEQRFLFGLLSGELRQGALEGVMTDAVARAASVPVADVRRAMMLRGSLGAVAAAALAGGSAALAAFGLEVGRPVRPMLAASASSISEALDKIGAGVQAAVEWKLDGIRIQAHLSGGSVRLFTRTLDDITGRLPEVVAVLGKLPVRAAVLDGELIALRADGRPLPFQDTSSRAASSDAGPAVPLSVFLFDALHLDGVDLIDLPDWKRHAELTWAVPPELFMPRLVTDSVVAATEFFGDAVARGHEGVVVKSLDTPYAAGRRGAGWIKVKPRHTLDLVVLAVEWGHGRRRGWLSNLHLGARDPATGGFVMLGKTFKGLTDELLTWQTSRLLALESRRDAYTVYVRPELVVEIAFDGVQRSPRYPGGLALRFARVLRYREDKSAAEADTIDMVRALAPE